jgi:hypothetical protein
VPDFTVGVCGAPSVTWTSSRSHTAKSAIRRRAHVSGQYVGNKFSLLRLRGVRVKPLGFPSWLNSEVNENDADGFDILDAKNAGYLCTIADDTPQGSCVSNARSINGTPVAAQMISKWVDYTSAQQCAKFITAEGTLTDPVLTDDAAYKRIQEIVAGNLRLFVPTKRINNVQLKFPLFSTAKTGLTKIEAASSWGWLLRAVLFWTPLCSTSRKCTELFGKTSSSTAWSSFSRRVLIRSIYLKSAGRLTR